ncbi:MAG TPA: hypothetical protein VF747_15680 [Blastocatellia bacterium]|jgi:hypothetical protein
MQNDLEERARKVREFFGLAQDTTLAAPENIMADIPAPVAGHLARFNIEWHIIPDADAVPFDDAYIRRMYAMCARSFASAKAHAASCRDALIEGHRRHQGRVLGVEATRKPVYLPGNRQYYGTPYGFDATADPFAEYLGSASLSTGTRYGHNYASLREFLDVVNQDWRSRGLMPEGYRLTICPPAVLNLIGNIFHPEWSETETLELGFYRDDHGNAKCYAVGSNGRGDFSYIHEVESNSDWTLLGFRTALVPE